MHSARREELDTSSQDATTAFFDANAAGYETWHYGQGVRSFMSVRQRRVLDLVDSLGVPGHRRALDAGCGPGYLLMELARRGFRIHGLDASVRMLERARARLREPDAALAASLLQAGVERLPYRSDSFDLVCCNGVIEYLPSDGPVLGELFRVLRAGGHLVIPITNIWSPANYFDPFIGFVKRRERLRTLLNKVLQLLGERPASSRPFRMRRHRPAAFRKALVRAGFHLEKDACFYLLPWPRPLDRLLPTVTNFLSTRLERYGGSLVAPLAEGYVALVSKPAAQP